MRKNRSSLLRADVTRSLADQSPDVQAAERQLRLRRGVYNVQPWGYALGVIGALLAVLFALYAASRHQELGQRLEAEATVPVPAQRPASTAGPAAPEPTEVLIEVE